MTTEDLKIILKEGDISKDMLVDIIPCIFFNGKSYTVKLRKKYVIVKEIKGRRIFRKRYRFLAKDLF